MGNAIGWLSLELEEDEGDDGLSDASSAPSLDELEFCPKQPKKAVIIFDWDDTLMCSTAIKLRKNQNQKQLQLLEEAVASVLRVAMDLGTTAIVTNANLTWVRTTAGVFMPAVVPLLDSVNLVSARQDYGRRWPGNHIAWKRFAFRDVVSGRSQARKEESMSATRTCNGVNLVVVGDSAAEIQAGRSVGSSRQNGEAIVKTVKLKEAPSVKELRGQLQALARALRRIVGEDKSSSKLLVRGGSSTCGWSVREVGCSLPFWDLAS
eukprot:CAMPEP_0179063976 /NCGR_PEP_ID=MMETSP0796-20121207/27713_1 /TAXON_ID=73915 /ORGANISM="Pyrodinium bahamense, Strain pbaha01" /LENGTH=263 /DNA_ID=CAMNT_0020760915 /DNA_START=57 /DNA_END=848 /DNA_ORIENTATION=+